MYQAVVCRVHTSPHPNADRLLVGLAAGSQVVVSTDTHDGDLGVFFPTDGQLSESMCAANNLVGYVDASGKKAGGFFAPSRRVRAQAFRGVKSDGYWAPLSCLAWTGADLSTLKEGDQFDTLNSQVVCRKYYTPATRLAMANQAANSTRARTETDFFRKHIDTAQFKRASHVITPGSVVYLTEKLHGTSGRYGHIPEPAQLGWLDRLRYRLCLGKRYTPTTWTYVHGSRNVILDDAKPGFYSNNDFRYDVMKGVFPRRGETLYFEIVGWVNEHTPIMPPQPIADKSLAKQYGDHMAYTYGCPEGSRIAYVYNITVTNPDGIATPLSYPQMAQRCQELGLRPVPLLDAFVVTETMLPKVPDMVEQACLGISTLCIRHIREGVVVRVENDSGTHFLKHKQWLFGVLEGYIKDDKTYVDIEEVA